MKSTMRYLMIDCTTENLLVAVFKDGELFDSSVVKCGFKHSQTVMSAIDDALQKSNLALCDLDFLACNVGPGSFTGIRIGVATAKGLQVATNKKTLGYTSLQVLHYHTNKKKCYIDSGNGYYFASYDKANCVDSPCLISYEQKDDNGAVYSMQENYLLATVALINDLAKDASNFSTLKPLYIRKSQAEVNKDAQKVRV